ncbi:MAG: AAA family ATPase, partial [Methanothrix sp.]|nr:AAA family ATPase [Methanothrix sp.]
VPVTARQLEALVRLSEASARLRLSNRIELVDAERAIRIFYSCLQKVGVDPETGFLDADVIATGITKTVRDKTKTIIDIIKSALKDSPAGARIDDVLNEAEAQGIERGKAEDIILRLRRDGQIFEQKSGLIKLV